MRLGEKHLLFSIKILLPNAVFCCTDSRLGTDKWEIAPDLGWRRQLYLGLHRLRVLLQCIFC